MTLEELTAYLKKNRPTDIFNEGGREEKEVTPRWNGVLPLVPGTTPRTSQPPLLLTTFPKCDLCFGSIYTCTCYAHPSKNPAFASYQDRDYWGMGAE